MRGLSLWMYSQVRPMRSSAPGAKFSTSTSQDLISAFEHAHALRVLGVDGDRALVVVEHGEVERVRALHVDQLAARDVADAGTLDLDDVGAEPGEQLRAGRARLHMREVEDAHAVERLAVLAERLLRQSSAAPLPLRLSWLRGFLRGGFATALRTRLSSPPVSTFGFRLSSAVFLAILLLHSFRLMPAIGSS